MLDFFNGVDISTGFIDTGGYEEKCVMWREYVKEIFHALYDVSARHPGIDIRCDVLHNSNGFFGFDRYGSPDGRIYRESDMLNVSVTWIRNVTEHEDFHHFNLKTETTTPYPIQRDKIQGYIEAERPHLASLSYFQGPNAVDLWTCDLDDFDFVMDKITYGHNLMMGVYDTRCSRPDYAIRDDVWIFLIALLRIFARYNEGIIFVPQKDKEQWIPEHMRLAPQFRR